MFDVSAYLNRIQYHGSVEPTLATLRSLHYSHMLHVPFENLDIHLGRPITLETEEVYTKIVNKNRGGFCYELNSLFAKLLQEIGFETTLISAHVAIPDGGYGPNFDHMAILVKLAGHQWLVDVGFGDSFREPIGFGPVSIQVRNAYRLVAEESGYWLLLQRSLRELTEKSLYMLTLTPRQIEDFQERCQYHQTSPQSPFTKGRLCTIATPEGRVTLTDKELVITTASDKKSSPVVSEEEYHSLLQQHFGIRFD